ncbi:MAG: phosphopentomutase [candidate division Zixibacteria bacterium]|nr:phosphopentomutase [candidate division Zixibacteria bacterium]
MSIGRIILVVIDGCGVGAMPDAADYGDAGTATIPHTAQAASGLNMPYAQRLGLGNIVAIEGVPQHDKPTGCYGKMAARSPGKDSTSGHWEITGLILDQPFPTYPNGFPRELVAEFERLSGVETIGNITASGTEIIERFGPEHLKTGAIILYTSADSVWQLAAHEGVYPLERQYELCRIARELLSGEHAVGRVIARPFVGSPGSFERTTGRRDFSLTPFADTILDLMNKNGLKVQAIGKTWDLLAKRGFQSHVKTVSNDEGMKGIIKFARDDRQHDMAFANLVDFDMLWGHRRDENGFARALEDFDQGLGSLLETMRDDDLVIITADHGCDPTFDRHTDHTREYVPLLVYGHGTAAGVNLGTRASFVDVACTIAEIFGLKHKFGGASFLKQITGEQQ